MSYVNGLNQRLNFATPVRPVQTIPRNQSSFQALLNNVPVRSATTPAPAPAPAAQASTTNATASDAPSSVENAFRQIFGAPPVASGSPAATATPAATAPAGTAVGAADLEKAMQIAGASQTPTPFVKSDGSLDWDAYTNNITDPQQKAALVNQLTFNYHYRQAGALGQRPLDNAVDNWGWDPYKTMQLRQQYGYTWVPSAGQNPVAIAPGLSAPGIAPYNPSQGPAGSITVDSEA